MYFTLQNIFVEFTVVLRHRSLEYCLKWESPMYPRRSPRLPKASKKSPKINPNSDEDVFQGGLKGKKQRTGQRRTRSDDGKVNAGERGRDIIDIINSTYEADHVAEENEATFVEFADKGLDESDVDCHSVNSSIASGPSLSYSGRPTQDRCPACQKLFQKASRMKAPIKKKVFDYGECTDWDENVTSVCQNLVKKNKMILQTKVCIFLYILKVITFICIQCVSEIILNILYIKLY